MSADLVFPSKWEKVLKKFCDGFKDAAESKNNDELQKEIMKAEAIISDLEKDMSADVKLQTLKSDLKDLKGGYNDSIKAEKAKSKYAIFLLKSRGAM